VSGSRKVFLAALAALGLLACERGHYETRDHAVSQESAGGEAAEGEPGAGANAGADAGAGAEGETGTAADAGADASAGGAEDSIAGSDDRIAAPAEGMQRGAAEAGPLVQVTVHSATGPITLWLARRAIGLQASRIDHCYRVMLGTDAAAAGSIRAMLTVQASGEVGAELETMAPELDRSLPCIDAALEDTQLPTATDGRPSHITLEISLAPHR